MVSPSMTLAPRTPWTGWQARPRAKRPRRRRERLAFFLLGIQELGELHPGEALVFAVDTAAVLLAVEAQVPGELAALREKGAQVGVEEGDACLLGYRLAHFLQEPVVLVGGDEEGGGKGVQALLPGLPGRPSQAQAEALDTSVPLPAHHPAQEVHQVITRGLYEGQ